MSCILCDVSGYFELSGLELLKFYSITDNSKLSAIMSVEDMSFTCNDLNMSMPWNNMHTPEYINLLSTM